jgi:hypothetical protein
MRTGTFVSAVVVALAFALLVSCGCGSSPRADGSAIVPVKGKVTYKGKPLTEGSITFEPDDFGREAHGSIKPDGTFVLTTFKEGDGAVRGLHRVAVTGSGKGVSVPVKFRTPSSSKVEVEVSDAKTDYAIDLK